MKIITIIFLYLLVAGSSFANNEDMSEKLGSVNVRINQVCIGGYVWVVVSNGSVVVDIEQLFGKGNAAHLPAKPVECNL